MEVKYFSEKLAESFEFIYQSASKELETCESCENIDNCGSLCEKVNRGLLNLALKVVLFYENLNKGIENLLKMSDEAKFQLYDEVYQKYGIDIEVKEHHSGFPAVLLITKDKVYLTDCLSLEKWKAIKEDNVKN